MCYRKHFNKQELMLFLNINCDLWIRKRRNQSRRELQHAKLDSRWLETGKKWKVQAKLIDYSSGFPSGTWASPLRAYVGWSCADCDWLRPSYMLQKSDSYSISWFINILLGDSSLHRSPSRDNFSPMASCLFNLTDIDVNFKNAELFMSQALA